MKNNSNGMNKIKISGILLCIIFVCVFNIFAASDIYSLRYTQVISSNALNAQTVTNNVWVKGKNMRMETKMQGQDVVTIVKDDVEVYVYYPSQNSAIMITIDEYTKRQLPKMQDFPAYLEKFNAKLVGQEIYDGKLCDIYEYEDSQQQANIKVWLWRDKKIPLKSIATTPNDVFTAEAKNLVLNAIISDDLFELPLGTKITNMQDMMQRGKSMQQTSGE